MDHASPRPCLAVAEDRTGHGSDEEVKRTGSYIKDEGLPHRSSADLSLPHQFHQADHGDQGRILKHKLPDISEARQGVPHQLRHDDETQRLEPGQAERLASLKLAEIDGEIRSAIDLGLLGARNEADRQDSSRKCRQPDEACAAEEFTELRQGNASAVV